MKKIIVCFTLMNLCMGTISAFDVLQTVRSFLSGAGYGVAAPAVVATIVGSCAAEDSVLASPYIKQTSQFQADERPYYIRYMNVARWLQLVGLAGGIVMAAKMFITESRTLSDIGVLSGLIGSGLCGYLAQTKSTWINAGVFAQELLLIARCFVLS